LLKVGPSARTSTVVEPAPPLVTPVIITSLPVCTKPRVLMLISVAPTALRNALVELYTLSA